MKNVRPVAINFVEGPAEISAHLPGVGPTWAARIFDFILGCEREASREALASILTPALAHILDLCVFDAEVVVVGRLSPEEIRIRISDPKRLAAQRHARWAAKQRTPSPARKGGFAITLGEALARKG